MTNNPLCPHCLTELQKHETTCWQCGDAVDLSADCVDFNPNSKIIFNDQMRVIENNHCSYLMKNDTTGQKKRPCENKLPNIVFYIAVIAFAAIFTMWFKGEL